MKAVEKGPQDRFLAHLATLCGNAYAGELVEFNDTDAPLLDEVLVMHVRKCSTNEIRIPFHVGADRSRTWIFTRTAGGLRLKHDHRHEDGSEDEITQYGGDTTEPGESTRQTFPADTYTRELIPASATNIWTVTVLPGQVYSYALRRPGGERAFRVDFDLTRTVDAPPAPWGHEDD